MPELPLVLLSLASGRLAGLVWLASVLLLVACGNAAQPQISLETTHIDVGDVVNGEIVSREVAVRNEGSGPLRVSSVTTSCSCTQAILESMTIAPGEWATLHIEFDSGAHGPELTGSLIRQIFINSNDPQQPEAQVELAANILAQSSP